MKRALILLVMFGYACGPRVGDKDKKPFNPDANNTSTNGGPDGSTNTMKGTTGTEGTNTAAPNNTSPNNTSPNNTSPNNTSPNNTTSNNTTATSNQNNTTVPPEVVQKCAKACDMLWGSCVQNHCDLDADVEQNRQEVLAGCQGTGGDAAELCTARYMVEPGYRDLVDELATQTCTDESVRLNRCQIFGTDQCTCLEPDLGAACTSDSQCSGGELPGICLAQEPDGSNPGGQCIAGGCIFDEGSVAGDLLVGGGTLCGEGGVCYVIDESSSVCLPTCTRNSDCDRGVTGANQSGYSCSIFGDLSDGSLLGICQEACGEALPCGDGLVCSTQSACEFECTSNSDCPLDFNCSGQSTDGIMYCESHA